MRPAAVLLACLAAAVRGDDRRLDHSYNGANCCDAEGIWCRDNCYRSARCLGSYCGDNCYGLWAMLPHCIPCVFCFDCKFTCEPWLGCAWDGVTDQHCADKGDVVQVPGYGLRSYRMGSTTCDSPPCPLIVAVHSWMATSDSAVATYNLDAHLPAGTRVVDYVNIDVEGAELAVLRVWPFDRYCVDVFNIENEPAHGAPSTLPALRALLEPRGYTHRVRVGVDEIFTRETPCARDAPLRPVSPAEVEAAADDAPPRRGGGRGGRGGGARRDARSSR